MILAIYNFPENGEHYNRNALFTNAFFSKIEQFRHASRHPKWKEVNIAAEVPGWTRFKPAQQWLDTHPALLAMPRQPAAGAPQQNTVSETSATSPGAADSKPLSEKDRDALYQEFLDYMAAHKEQGAAH